MASSTLAIAKVTCSDEAGLRGSTPNVAAGRRIALSILSSPPWPSTPPVKRPLTIRRWSRSASGARPPTRPFIPRRNDLAQRSSSREPFAGIHLPREQACQRAYGRTFCSERRFARYCFKCRRNRAAAVGGQLRHATLRLFVGHNSRSLSHARSRLSRPSPYRLLLGKSEFKSEHSAPAGENGMRLRRRLRWRTGARSHRQPQGSEESCLLGSRQDSRRTQGRAEGRHSPLQRRK